MQERAVLYARISVDKTGEEVGVTRQLVELRQLAASRDYKVVDEIIENDISASKGLHRPGYEKVWDLVRNEQIDHVIVWQTSRLMRSRADRAEVINTFGEHRVDVIAVKGPSLDLRSAYGRGMADMLTAFDSMEGEVKAERVSAAIRHLARGGKAWGFAPYGWDRTGRGTHAKQVVNPAEAAIVAELVDRLLAGESLHSLYRDMNDREVPAPGYAVWMKLPEEAREQRVSKGRKPPTERWAKSTVRTLVARDANAAIRSRAADGTTISGDWPPIVDAAKHDRIVAMLRAPERRSHTGPRPGARKHLLTAGIGKCGVCGGPLRVARRNGRRDDTLIYMCEGKYGCTGRTQARVDEMVAAVVIERLSRPDALDWLVGDDEEARRSTQHCEDLQRQLDEAADLFIGQKITGGQMERITAGITPRLQAARRERDSAIRGLDVEALRPLAGPEAHSRWEGMSAAAQRAVLETLGVEVTILPRVKHGPGFEPEMVRITWKQDSSLDRRPVPKDELAGLTSELVEKLV